MQRTANADAGTMAPASTMKGKAEQALDWLRDPANGDITRGECRVIKILLQNL